MLTTMRTAIAYACSSKKPLAQGMKTWEHQYIIRYFCSQHQVDAGGERLETANTSKADSFMSLPGHEVPYTNQLELIGGARGSNSIPSAMPVFRVMSAQGEVPSESSEYALTVETALPIYKTMLQLQVMDTVFFEAQRQGRFSFYMTSTGEEAAIVASAAALQPKDDIFGQYREHGAFLWRGFTMRNMADQCFGNLHDDSKGRQMPIHYGSKDLHLFTISSVLGTQLPHAAGAAYALKMQGTGTVAATYFGEGASSTGDFHAAFNFAATLKCPVVFICRNNGYAISTPSAEQFLGPGIAERGPAYGIPSVRVDGRDAMAVYRAVQLAREVSLRDSTPTLVECMSYRIGHHSTSDDSTRYREASETAQWSSFDPAQRLGAWLSHQGEWTLEDEKATRTALRRDAVDALSQAGRVTKHPATDLFTDVYKEMPQNLREQQAELADFLTRHPHLLPNGVPVTK